MKKKVWLIVGVLMLLGVYQVNAAFKTKIDVVFNNVNLFIDGDRHELSKPAIVYEGTTYLPIRDIGEITGKEVTWNGNSNSISLGKSNFNIQGEKIYQLTCAMCHGQNLEGGVGPELYTVGSRLTADEIESIILNGQGGMPAGMVEGIDAVTASKWLATYYNKKDPSK